MLNSSEKGKGIDVSVVICAYNAEDRLAEVLDALSSQVVPAELRWELLLVDNNSKDQTAEVARGYISRIGNGSLLRVIAEPMQGLIYARRCGWQEAKGSIISFLDDDNVVAADWVVEVWNFFQAHPQAGMVGPKILPLLDFEPPPYFNYIKLSLAIWNLGDEPLNTTHTSHGHPPGAGMSCRRERLASVLGQNSFRLTGRNGDQLTSGEDSMIAIAIRRAGWEWWYEPRMVLGHRLPKSRLDIPYLLRLFRGMGLSSAQIAEAHLDHPLPTGKHLEYVFNYAVRFVLYTLVRFAHPDLSRRIYARFLTTMFRAGIEAHSSALFKTIRQEP